MQTEESAVVQTLQARLDGRLRELQNAEVTIHVLKLEQLARDRQICDLKARIFELETSAAGSHDERQSRERREDEPGPELYDALVAAAEQERATHLEYIEHLKAQLAAMQSQARE
ncbi:MAG: hypothetical protein JO233_08830 [Candidatus Eremiobacteraeota bacterium]|nr:hypothetical protein [Candidatus Eremiobacteraeota bacterium]